MAESRPLSHENRLPIDSVTVWFCSKDGRAVKASNIADDEFDWPGKCEACGAELVKHNYVLASPSPGFRAERWEIDPEDFKQAQELVRAGDTEGIAEFLSRNVKARAEAAAEAARSGAPAYERACANCGEPWNQHSVPPPGFGYDPAEASTAVRCPGNTRSTYAPGAPASEVEAPDDRAWGTSEGLSIKPGGFFATRLAGAGPAGETDQRTWTIRGLVISAMGGVTMHVDGPRLSEGESVEVAPKSALARALRQRALAWRIGDADLKRTMAERDRALRERDEAERERDEQATNLVEARDTYKRERDEAREALNELRDAVFALDLSDEFTLATTPPGALLSATRPVEIWHDLRRAAGSEEENDASA